MTPEAFFEQPREWSRWKHQLLRRYLGKFSGILGSKHPAVYFIDGFAGAGRYGNPNEDGSPVIAARIAADQSGNQRPCTLRCINVEPQYFDELVAATAEFDQVVIENRRGTFREHLPDILKTISGCPALFFLDPFGHKGMEWDAVSQIAARATAGQPTEVLLNFYSSEVDRAGGWIDSSHRLAPAFVASLDELFGTSEWQALYLGGHTKRGRMEALTRLYLTRLANAFRGIAASYEVVAEDGTPKYDIIYGTRSLLGCREMSDVVYRVSEDCRTTRTAARQAAKRQLALFEEPGSSPEERDEKIAEALAHDVHSLKEKGRSFSFVDLQNELLPLWFGKAVSRHYRAACRRLEAEGKLVVPPRQGGRRQAKIGISDTTLLTLI
jgi:three-Cys-motif partner protein